VPAVVEIASRDAFNARQLDGIGEQAGTLHANSDDSEAQAIARCHILQRQRNIFRLKKNSWRCRKRACGSGRAVKELTAGKIFFHRALLKKPR
jgi:hypothetical protein